MVLAAATDGGSVPITERGPPRWRITAFGAGVEVGTEEIDPHRAATRSGPDQPGGGSSDALA